MPLSSYVLPLTAGAFLMGFSYFLGRYNYSFGWIAVFVVLNFVKSKMWKQREKRLLAMRQTALHEKEVIEMMSTLPSWVQFPDTERVEWINKVIMQSWPYIGEYVKFYMKENIEPMVKAQMPSPFKSFRFDHIDMGDVPCRVHGIKVYTQNVGRDRVIMDMDVAYAGDCEFVVGVGAFKGGMNNLQFSGKLRAVLHPLLPYPPLVGGVSAFFLDNPSMDFNLTGMGEMVELPGLMAAVRSVVMSQMQAICVLPNQITVPLVPNIDIVSLQFPEPDGVLRIHVVEAKDLENKDISFLKKGRSDPYAVITLGNQVMKTKVVDDNLNPVWNEFYELVVAQADGQRLRIELYDEDAGNDEELGRISVDMDVVRQKAAIDSWYPLESVARGTLHLKMYWMSLSRNPRDLEVDQWESEWLKANRTMHSALLMVYVDHASDLPFPKVGVEPSPIISLELGNEVKKTFPKFKTINPVWQEKFIFFCSRPESSQLKVQAIDEGTKRSLGQTVVSLNGLLTERNLEFHQTTFSLSLGTHQSPLVMTIRLRALRGGNMPNAGPTHSTITTLPTMETTQGYVVGTDENQNLHTNPNVQAAYNSQNMSMSSTLPNPKKQLHPKNGREPLKEYHGNELDRVSLTTQSMSGTLERSKMKKRNSVLGRWQKGGHAIDRGSLNNLSIGNCGKLECSIRYLMETNKLAVHILQAQDLHSIDKAGTADAYCQIKLSNQHRDHHEKVKTHVALGTLQPVWDQVFEFDVHPKNVGEYKVVIKVKDAAPYGIFSSPPVLGKYTINLCNFDTDRVVHEWFELLPYNSA